MGPIITKIIILWWSWRGGVRVVSLITHVVLWMASVYQPFFEDWGRRGRGQTLLPPGRRISGVQGCTSWCWWGGFSPRYICTCWILLYVFRKSIPPLDVDINNSECFAGAFPNLALVLSQHLSLCNVLSTSLMPPFQVLSLLINTWSHYTLLLFQSSWLPVYILVYL